MIRLSTYTINAASLIRVSPGENRWRRVVLLAASGPISISAESTATPPAAEAITLPVGRSFVIYLAPEQPLYANTAEGVGPFVLSVVTHDFAGAKIVEV